MLGRFRVNKSRRYHLLLGQASLPVDSLPTTMDELIAKLKEDSDALEEFRQLCEPVPGGNTLPTDLTELENASGYLLVWLQNVLEKCRGACGFQRRLLSLLAAYGAHVERFNERTIPSEAGCQCRIRVLPRS